MNLLHIAVRVAQNQDSVQDEGDEMGKIEFDGDRELRSWLNDVVAQAQKALLFDGTEYRVEQEGDCLALYELTSEGEDQDPPFQAARIRIISEKL